jgi:hypothetical protein
VDQFAKIVGGSLGVEVRPEGVEKLFAVEMMTGGEGEKLYDAFGFARGPLVVGDEALADGYAEAAEEIDTHLFGRRVLGGGPLVVLKHRHAV